MSYFISTYKTSLRLINGWGSSIQKRRCLVHGPSGPSNQKPTIYRRPLQGLQGTWAPRPSHQDPHT